MENLTKAIGMRIRAVRNRQKLTQKEFARELGISDKSVSAYEVGDVLPPIDTLLEIVKMGKKSLDWLVSGFDVVPQSSDLTSDELQIIRWLREIEKEDRTAILRIVENTVCASRARKHPT